MVSQTIERLEFYASLRIAHAVRRITIRPSEEFVGRRGNPALIDPKSISAIGRKLGAFTGLVTLVCERFQWSELTCADFAEVGRVQELEIRECAVRLSQPVGTRELLRVDQLKVTSSDLERFPLTDWYSMVDAREVSLVVGQPHRPCLVQLSESPDIVKNLQGLVSTVPRTPNTYLLLNDIIRDSSHSLQSLHLNFERLTRPDALALLEWPKAPLLHTYFGPIGLLVLISTAESLRNIRHLYLHDVKGSSFEPETLLQTIEEIGTPTSRLETLTFSAIGITDHLLQTVFRRHPYLKNLTITSPQSSDDPEENENEVPESSLTLEVRLFALHLGSALAQFCLQETLHAFSTMDLPPDIKSMSVYMRNDGFLVRSRCLQVRDTLAHKHPSLERVVLQCGSMFSWQRGQDNGEPGRFTCEHGYGSCDKEPCQEQYA